jgi:predicted AlkP superfamily pyrophosphatase or phosphodiesterase
MPSLYSQTVWESTVPEAARGLTRPDTSRFEQDRVHTAFPHLAGELVDAGDPGDLNSWRYTYTPFPDAAVLALAEEAVRTLRLGGRASPDYLAVSLSQTDLVGHYYGPGSREQLDNLLRLDAELGRFFTYLDDAVGAGRWVLALSADHGVLEIPEELAATGVDAARLTRDDRASLLAAIRDAGGTAEFTRQGEVGEALSRLPFVAATYTFDAIESGQPADSFAVLYANSHSRTRVVDLENRVGVYARLLANRLTWAAPAATHGSPYYYDRHVPIIFLGGAIPAGTSTERAATVDVAPTLARLAGIETPTDLDGRVLGAVLR